MFSSEDAIENLSMEEVRTDSAYKNANVNEHQSNMRFDNFDNSKDSNQTKDNDREFNLKRAVIYSAVLDRPYI